MKIILILNKNNSALIKVYGVVPFNYRSNCNNSLDFVNFVIQIILKVCQQPKPI